MPETTIYMNAPVGRTYGYRGVRFEARRPYAVSSETAAYLTGVLKGDGSPLFVEGAPPVPALADDGTPLPLVDATSQMDEHDRVDRELSANERGLPEVPTEEEPEVEPEDPTPPKRKGSKRAKQE